jgi:hypothetical protein
MLQPSIAAPSIARAARAVTSTARACGNGPLPSLVPEDPNSSLLAPVAGRPVWNPSIAHNSRPHHNAACPRGVAGPAIEPAACQNTSSMTCHPSRRRQLVNTLAVGTCQRLAHGTSSRCPASRAIVSR